MSDTLSNCSVGKSPSQVTMINQIVKHFPISDNFANVEFKIPKTVYTTEEVDALIDSAVAEAKAIDEASMKKHNRDATVRQS